MASNKFLRKLLVTSTLLVIVVLPGCKRQSASPKTASESSPVPNIPGLQHVTSDETATTGFWLSKAERDMSELSAGPSKSILYCRIANIYSFLGQQPKAKEMLLLASGAAPGRNLSKVAQAQANLGFASDALLTIEKNNGTQHDKDLVNFAIAAVEDRAGHLVASRKARSEIVDQAALQNNQFYNPEPPLPPFIPLYYANALDDLWVLNVRTYVAKNIKFAFLNADGIKDPQRKLAAYVAIAVLQSKSDKDGSRQTFQIAKEQASDMKIEYYHDRGFQLIVEGEVRAGFLDDAFVTVIQNVKGDHTNDCFGAIAKTYYIHSRGDVERVHEKIEARGNKAAFALGIADATIMSKRPPTTQPQNEDHNND
jgi:hypothetical protein